MTILAVEKLNEFGKDYAQVRKRLSTWRNTVELAAWNDPIEMRATFPTADLVGPRTVFDIGSNRIITIIGYKEQIVLIDDVLIHDDYMKEKWKR